MYKAHYCAQRQNIKGKFGSRKSKHGVFVLFPTQKVPSVVEWMIKSLQKVKVRVKTSHLIFG